MDKSLEAKIRYQVACEEKARRIVEQLIEPGISENVLTEAGLYITPDHYQDITEERSITQLCGYPICDNKITKVLSQKYHISTKTNKVYDITDRKNFCSNECYKASVFFQKQIATSPLWTRKEEKPKLIELLPKELNRGSVGKEVINKHTELYREARRLRDEEEKEACQKTARVGSKTEKQDKNVQDVVAGVEKLSVNENQGDVKSPEFRLEVRREKHEKNFDPKENSTEKHEGTSSGVLSTDSPENEQSKKIQRLMALLDRRKNLLGKLVQDEKAAQLQTTTNSTKVSTAESAGVSTAKSCEENNEDSDDSCDDSGKDFQSDVKDRKTIVQSCDTAINERATVGAISKKSDTLSVQTKENNPSETSYLGMVCELMKEWVSPETLTFLDCPDQEMERQAGISTEMEAKIKDLCRRVDQQETALDGLIGEQESLEDKLPVWSLAPDYKSLKKETEEFSHRVHNFFAGGKIVTEKEVKSQRRVYLPSVDSHDQLLIRQRIVMDQLNKVIPDLLPPLKLSIQDVFTELKQLVTTFRLTSKNILFKPAEWSLVGLLLLKFLSRKNLQVSCAFLNPSAVQYFSIFLGGIGEKLEKVDFHVTRMLQQQGNKI